VLVPVISIVSRTATVNLKTMSPLLRTSCCLVILQLITVAGPVEGKSSVPQQLDIYVGNPIFGNWTVVLHGRSLTYTQKQPQREDSVLVVTPTDEQWRAFHDALQRLAVFQWQPDYPNNGVVDGTQWGIEIVYPERAVKSHGDNNFPDAHGKPNASPRKTRTFQAFVDATKKLLGSESLFPDSR
jgi:hypothetical protein